MGEFSTGRHQRYAAETRIAYECLGDGEHERKPREEMPYPFDSIETATYVIVSAVAWGGFIAMTTLALRVVKERNQLRMKLNEARGNTPRQSQ